MTSPSDEQRIANLERDLQALEVAHNDVSKTAGEINRVIANYLLVLTKALCESGTLSEEVGLALTEKLVSQREKEGLFIRVVQIKRAPRDLGSTHDLLDRAPLEPLI